MIKGVVKSIDAGFVANLLPSWFSSTAIVTFDTLETFDGGQLKSATVATTVGPGGHCGINFIVGETYLVYALKNTHFTSINTPYEASACSRTRPISAANEDLEFLRTLSTNRLGEISGSVSKQRSNFPGKRGDRNPAANSLITINSVNHAWQVKTDERGEYRVSNLPPGEYELHVVSPHSVSFDSPRSIRLAPGGCAVEDLSIEGTASIGGTLYSSEGISVARQIVDLVSYTDRNANCDRTLTDSNGRFRFAGLDAGKYYVGVSICTPPQPYNSRTNRSNPYSMHVYPGASTFDGGDIVELRSGQSLTLKDWRLPKKLDARIIRGRVINPNSGGFGQFVSLIDPNYEDMVEWVLTDERGYFELRGYQGIDYSIEVIVANRGRRRWPVPEVLEGSMTLTVE